MHSALLVSGDVSWPLSLAEAWVAAGDEVTVVLLDAAAGSARRSHGTSAQLRRALRAGVAVAAEERALKRRALAPDGLVDGVKVVDLDEVADLVADGSDRAVWL